MKIANIEVQYVDHMGNDNSVANAARVSFAKGAENYTKEQNDKLLIYLAKNKHYSPFNHTFMSFKIKAPIFVSRQLVKHRFMPWNEVSRRYVNSDPEFYMPSAFRAKAENVKQGSGTDMMRDGQNKCYQMTSSHADRCLGLYRNLLCEGMCAEQARMVLPQNTMTEWIWSGTLGAFADMLKLRLDPHTQKESRDIAELIYAQALPLFPVSLKALLESK